MNISQPTAPPSLLHLQFPPPFPPNQPPPPISQTYQIQYQPLQTSIAHSQASTQFIIHGEHGGPLPPPQNHEPHMAPPFEGQPPPQLQMHPQPPSSSQGYIVPTSQAIAEHGPPQQPMATVNDLQHGREGLFDCRLLLVKKVVNLDRHLTFVKF